MNRRQRQHIMRATTAITDIVMEGHKAFSEIVNGKDTADMGHFRQRVLELADIYVENVIKGSHEAYVILDGLKNGPRDEAGDD